MGAMNNGAALVAFESRQKRRVTMAKVVLLRHGESTWNRENKFTGWTDVDLSPKGVEEAHSAAEYLMKEGFTFDIAFTSFLKRAVKTLWTVMEDMDLMWIPVFRSWRLNERHYGALQGLNKSQTVKDYGEEQVLLWRRSYDTPPPALARDDSRFPGRDRRYGCLSPEELPLTESLKDTVERFLPYWNDVIVPEIKKGKRVIIAAHGNSLRALVKHLDNVSDEDIVKLNIPTGVPLVYELDPGLKSAGRYYLGDPERIKKAVESVASQAKR